MIHYDMAEKALAAGEYDTASVQFKAAGDYSDAAERVNEPYYLQGAETLLAKQYDQAYELFEKAGNYSDAQTQKKEARYQQAVELMENSRFDEAYSILRKIADYKDAELLLQKTNYSDIVVGDIITLGRYEQDGDLDNGMEEIEWQVLDRENDTALLISKYALEKKSYHWNEQNTLTSATWETCALRQWLNNDFMNTAFDSQEKALMVESLVTADENPYKYGIADQGNDTFDKVFILSIKEAERYFSTRADARCTPTDYVIKYKASKLHHQLGTCSWMLRTLGKDQHQHGWIDDEGYVAYVGNMFYAAIGIRPAIRIKLAP